MKNQITFSQYRAIDLSILMAMLGFSQLLIHFAASFWFPDQLYVVSPVAAVTTLVMMRWSGFGAIHAVLGGLLFAAVSGGGWQQYMIYGGGNLLSLLALLMLNFFGKEKVRQSGFLSLTFGLSVQILMQIGRAGLAAVLGYPFDVCLRFITTDTLSWLFTAFVVWIMGRVDGLFEDQKHYLLRMEQERQNERRDQF